MAKSRNPLKDLSNLTEMPIVKNWNMTEPCISNRTDAVLPGRGSTKTFDIYDFP